MIEIWVACRALGIYKTYTTKFITTLKAFRRYGTTVLTAPVLCIATSDCWFSNIKYFGGHSSPTRPLFKSPSQLDQEYFFGYATPCSCIGTWFSEAVLESLEPEAGIGATDKVIDKRSTSIEGRWRREASSMPILGFQNYHHLPKVILSRTRPATPGAVVPV